MRSASIVVALAISGAGLAPFATAEIVLLAPSQDNTLYQHLTGSLSNGAGEYFFAGKNASGNIRRGLIAFDVAGGIPQGAIVTGVKLQLNMSMTASGPTTVGLHRVANSWGEGDSDALANEGGGIAPTAGDATWLHRRFATELWINEGGDFAETASATQVVAGLGDYLWGSTPGMVADVQAWLDNPATNFGWLLKGDESAASTAKRFASAQNTVVGIRPQLTIEFTKPPALGDLNGDGTINNLDIDDFAFALTDPAGYEAAFPGINRLAVADINLDLTVDNLDIDPFVAILTAGGATAAPEPPTILLAMAGAAGLLGMARCRRG